MTPQIQRRKCTPIFGLHGNKSKFSGHISRFRHDFTRRYRCVISEWTGSAQLHCRTFFLRGHTFKMYTGAFEWPYTCKLQYFKFCCRFCCRSRNRRMFCDRKRCHNPTAPIRRNGTSTSHYTSMHGQHYSCCNCKWHNQASVITGDEYASFLYSWPKNFKNIIAWKSGQINLADYFKKLHSVKHHKRVRPVYLQTDKTTQTVLLILLQPDLKGCVDPADSKMEEFRKTLTIP